MSTSSASDRLMIGYGSTTERVPRHPARVRMSLTKFSNGSVMTTTAALPLVSAATVSCAVQEVHEPQLPKPTTARSTSPRKSASSASVCSPALPVRPPARHRLTSAPADANI